MEEVKKPNPAWLNRWRHFKVISRHHRIVRKWCFRMGIPWQGLTHDLSKFGPTEFNASAQFFQGKSSPIDAEKRANGYSIAWQHHKGRNPHHWEYWIDRLSTKENYAIKIPYKYVIEMVADFVGAGQAYNPGKWTPQDPLAFYEKKKDQMLMHPGTRALFVDLLTKLSSFGEKKFVKMVRSNRKYWMKAYDAYLVKD